MFDKYAYYSKKEIVSDVEQPTYGTNDRGKEEKQYTMGVLSLSSNQDTDSSGGTSSNPSTGSGGGSTDSTGNLDLGITATDIFDASSNRKADMLKAIGEYYSGPWYDNQDGTHIFNSYGFTPLMMATQSQCYESMKYILGKIDNNKYEDQENIKHLYDAAYQKHEKITDDDSSKRSAVKIAQDNKDTKALEILNEHLDDWVYTIKYINSKHTDLKIQLPASDTVFKGDKILLPSITGRYVSSNEEEPIRWEPKRWYIVNSGTTDGGQTCSFNTYYALAYDADAILVCDKAHVTLTYSLGAVQTDIELPGNITIQSGSEITLGKANGEYKDNDSIRWIATGWTIDTDGEIYQFDEKYTLYDDTVAVLNLEKVKVTLTYIDENNLNISNFPEDCEVPCGDPITLPTLDEKYTAQDRIVWNLLGWTIDDTSYEFGAEYKIYENKNAKLKCEKASATLTFKNPYESAEFAMPSLIIEKSGTQITLPSIEGTYRHKQSGNKYKTYTPSKWTIDESEYDFGTSYTLYTDTDAELLCDVSVVTIGIIFDKVLLSLKEGDSKTRTFKLESEPFENVTLNLSSPNPDRLAISPSTLVFTQANWNVEQTVTFTAKDDDIDDDLTNVKVAISVTSNDIAYNELHDLNLTVSITDDDSAGIDVATSQLTIAEGTFDERSFKLKSQPADNVKLIITTKNASNNDTQLGVSSSELLFTPNNWDAGQAVRFTATENYTADGATIFNVSVSATSGDPKYSNLSPVSFKIRITDNDTVGIDYRSNFYEITEGGSTMCFFKLKSKPKGDVKLNIAVESGSDRLSVSKSSLTFTESNWNDEQTVELTATNNTKDDGDVTSTIKVTVDPSSLDSKYKALGPISFTITIKDNDTAGIDYNKSSMTLTEGDSYITRSFKLKSQPTGNVTLTISSDITDRLYIYNSSSSSTTTSTTLTFTTSNYGNAQFVYFKAKDDTNANGNETGKATVKVSSTDSKYNNLSESFNITVNDNDTASIGKFAFETGVFTVEFVDDIDSIMQFTKDTENTNPQEYLMEELKVKEQWSLAYDEGYTVEQIPKSPNWSSTNKVFDYNLFYDDDKEY